MQKPYQAARSGEPRMRREPEEVLDGGCAARQVKADLVSLFAQEGRNVVGTHAIGAHRLDRGAAGIAHHRGNV